MMGQLLRSKKTKKKHGHNCLMILYIYEYKRAPLSIELVSWIYKREFIYINRNSRQTGSII